MTVRYWHLAAAVASALSLTGCEVRDTSQAGNSADAAARAPEVSGPSPAPAAPAVAAQAPALAEAESQNGNYRLSVTEASRSNGVLTIKARVTLLSGETGNRRLLYESEARELYLLAGDQKFMILKDNEGDPLTTEDGYSPGFDRLGDTNSWWAKFPAPPPEVKSVGLYFRGFLPVENIPITDR